MNTSGCTYRKHIVLLYLLLCCAMLAFSQTQESEQTVGWQTYYEMLLASTEEEEQTSDMEDMFEQLSEIAANPINLNAITREDLESMMCFDERQADDILDYITRYGPVRTKAELLMIHSLDPARIGLLTTLTYLGEMPPRQMDELDSLKFKAGLDEYRRYSEQKARKGEVAAFVRVPFYKRKGEGDAYKGHGMKHWLRASYDINSHVKVGVVAAEDASEPFFEGKKNYGYDFYSGFVQLRRLGIVEKAVVGRYRLKTGLGLILNNNYSFGKLFSLSSIQTSRPSLRPHASRTECNYLQGGAITLRPMRNLELTAFASHRTIDATLTKDSTAIATILTSGYHRTESELARRHNARQTSFGANVYWTDNRFHVGMTALANNYSMPLQPYPSEGGDSYLYKMFYASGKQFWNASVEYGYKHGKLLRFAGETAIGDCRRVATINTLSISPTRQLTVMVVQRYYPYRFYATMGNSFSEGGANQNENGVYLGVNWNPNSRLSVVGYSDFAYFAWPKYQALGSSRSIDNLVQASYKLSSRSSLTARYRLKCREKNGEENVGLIYKNEHRGRLTYNHRWSSWNLKAQADFACCKYKKTDFGGMLSSYVTYAMKAVKAGIGCGAFLTDSYDARVYAYEQTTPYNLSFPSFYGKGCRLYALAEYSPTESIVLNAKVGFTRYFDRDTIGSSYQTINSPMQTDLDIMLRWRFH